MERIGQVIDGVSALGARAGARARSRRDVGFVDAEHARGDEQVELGDELVPPFLPGWVTVVANSRGPALRAHNFLNTKKIEIRVNVDDESR